MHGPTQLRHLMRRYGRFAVVALALLGLLTVVATVHAAHADGAVHHATSHPDAIVLCVVVGGCALAIAGSAAAVRRLVQRGLWTIAALAAPATPSVRRHMAFLTRAGPPPALQVFRL